MSPWRATLLVLVSVCSLFGCEGGLPPGRCVAANNAAPASATEVCARLRTIGCFVRDDAGVERCEALWQAWQRELETEDFRLVTQCYVSASTCSEVSACERGCGPDSGSVRRRSSSTDSGFDATLDAE